MSTANIPRNGAWSSAIRIRIGAGMVERLPASCAAVNGRDYSARVSTITQRYNSYFCP
jgi:hypothetical protein